MFTSCVTIHSLHAPPPSPPPPRTRVDLESLACATCTPTPRISQYVQGDDADESGTQVCCPCLRLHSSIQRMSDLAAAPSPHCRCRLQIIVETNFRVYAYTTSYVDFQILSRFATIIEKFPDMCVRSCAPCNLRRRV